MNRKIAVITGTRADYGLFYYVLKAIEEHPNLDLELIVTGMHLCPEYGMTVNEIEKNGFNISEKIETILASDTGVSMAKTVGLSIVEISQALNRINPDILVILGDRGEMLAGAISAIHLNIPIAHIHGGEVTGTVDESVRHAITKLSHIHLPANEDSKERIIKLGEKKENIFVVGAPGLDYIRNAEYLSREEINKRFALDDSEFIIMTQHPVTTEREQVRNQIIETMEAVKELRKQIIISYPNSDNGGREIIEIIDEYSEKYSFINTYKNLSQIEYLSILKYASVMVGNSSSGIIEAPSFKLPVVNIGTRQNGRLRANNIIDVENNKEEIKKAIEYALYNEDYKKILNQCVNLYGDGKSGKRIAKILNDIKIDSSLIQKRITY
ncbi:UDP-N-acetylglucosamine 2-epimerase [Clostridium sp. DL1XJH146]